MELSSVLLAPLIRAVPWALLAQALRSRHVRSVGHGDIMTAAEVGVGRCAGEGRMDQCVTLGVSLDINLGIVDLGVSQGTWGSRRGGSRLDLLDSRLLVADLLCLLAFLLSSQGLLALVDGALHGTICPSCCERDITLVKDLNDK